MKFMIALLAALVMAPALAQSPPKPKPQSVPAKSLDLRLPPQDLPAAPASSASAAGVYYGDVGGGGVRVEGNRPHEDYRTHVSGSVGTSIGYAKGFGTDVSNAAELNVSKRFQSGGGMDLHLRVLKDHGFHDRWPDGEAGH